MGALHCTAREGERWVKCMVREVGALLYEKEVGRYRHTAAGRDGDMDCRDWRWVEGKTMGKAVVMRAPFCVV